MKADLGIPGKLSSIASTRPVTNAEIPALVEVAINDTCHRTNPRKCAREDFARIFAEAI
jgi:alcohol dehydrogenase class IV